MNGICALCGQNAKLIDSHFLPAALYQEMNDPTGPIKNMVVVTPRGSFQSAEQFHMHLLCLDCEIRFQKGGENWTLAMRYRSDGTFPLRDLLLASTPSSSNAIASVYDVSSNANVDVDQLVYFAASILWRAGIADWNTRFANAPKIDLPATLMSTLAAFLLGNGPFPSDVFLIVSLAPESQPIRTLLSPVKVQETPFTRCEAHIPGMMFEWFIGADTVHDTWSLNNPPSRIILTNLIRQRLLAVAAANVPMSEPKGSLKKHVS